MFDRLVVFGCFGWFRKEGGAFSLEGVDASAAGDHEEPGGEFAAGGVEGFEATKGFHEDILGDVFGEALVVMEDSGEHADEWVLVGSDEGCEGIGFSVQGAADDFEFFGFGH